jgi:phospholipid/cholesterol/gamma-HCH transport system substrate-binding protein
MKYDINMKARLTFVAFLFILIIAGAIWYFFSENRYAIYQLYTEDSVSGLIADAPIEFHGVDVGKVKSIKLITPHSVSILLRIDKAAPVTSASVATITSRGLATRGFTGYVYISLEDVGIDSRPLATPPGAPYPIIPTAPSKVMTLDTTITQVKDHVQVVTELLQSMLDKKTILSLKQSADNLQQVTKVLAHNTKKLDSIVANTERASDRFEPLLASSQDSVKAFQTQTLPDARQALTDLDNLLQSGHDAVEALQTQMFPDALRALSNLDDLSTTFMGVASKINRDPSILIRGSTPPPLGPGETQ